MKRNDYLREVVDDVKQYIQDNYSQQEVRDYVSSTSSRNRFLNKLNDDLFCDDSVTGNASGSYTFNTEQARINVQGAEDATIPKMQSVCCFRQRTIGTGGLLKKDIKPGK